MVIRQESGSRNSPLVYSTQSTFDQVSKSVLSSFGTICDFQQTVETVSRSMRRAKREKWVWDKFLHAIHYTPSFKFKIKGMYLWCIHVQYS